MSGDKGDQCDMSGDTNSQCYLCTLVLLPDGSV